MDALVATLDRALAHYPIERLFLNPDCGFGTFANRPMNSDEVAWPRSRGWRRPRTVSASAYGVRAILMDIHDRRGKGVHPASRRGPPDPVGRHTPRDAVLAAR